MVHSDGDSGSNLLLVKRSTSSGLLGRRLVRHRGLLEALFQGPVREIAKKLATLKIKTSKPGELPVSVTTPPGHGSAEWAASMGTSTSTGSKPRRHGSFLALGSHKWPPCHDVSQTGLALPQLVLQALRPLAQAAGALRPAATKVTVAHVPFCCLRR